MCLCWSKHERWSELISLQDRGWPAIQQSLPQMTPAKPRKFYQGSGAGWDVSQEQAVGILCFTGKLLVQGPSSSPWVVGRGVLSWSCPWCPLSLSSPYFVFPGLDNVSGTTYLPEARRHVSGARFAPRADAPVAPSKPVQTLLGQALGACGRCRYSRPGAP